MKSVRKNQARTAGSTFCVAQLPEEKFLRPEHGVLRAASLMVTADARAAAERTIKDAIKAAAAHTKRADTKARQTVLAAEQEALARIDLMLKALQATEATLLDGTQDMVIGLATALFERLVMETTPRERMEAVLRRVIHEAPSRLPDAVLHVHPDDVALLPELEWRVKSDASMPPGACRLAASNGEWCMDFASAARSLKSALAGCAGGMEKLSDGA